MSSFLFFEISSKKVHQNNIDFSLIEIMSKKVRRNNIDFSLIEKVRRSDVHFLPIEITSKKYVEMKWKIADIFSSTYRRNIAIESTSI